jgi:Flp pilus assembly pilin Flp
MKISKLFRRFVREEEGAVTVDWVVLTAAIVGLATAIILLVQGGTEDLAGEISSALAGITVST